MNFLIYQPVCDILMSGFLMSKAEVDWLIVAQNKYKLENSGPFQVSHCQD